MTTLRRDPSKALLVGFLALLVVSTVQVAWWVTDHVRYTHEVERRLAALYRNDAEAVTAFLRGRVPENLGALMPHLDVDRDDERARVAPDALAELERDRARRNNRYVWEGLFFLAVLIGGMAVLTRAIRHDRALRRRQQNFLAAVSHEFKSPLASMRLAAETLVMRSKDPDTERVGRRILEDGERLLRMVDNLLDTARLEEGRQSMHGERVPLGRAADAAAAEIGARAALHGIEVRTDTDEETELYIDRAALDTILRNLLDNAVKACAAGGGRSVTVTARRTNDGAEVRVADDGIGFPPEEAAMIFEKFHRLGDELRRQTPGTGLGLYIVKRLVELSGGSIRAASEGPGRGATITVTWPTRSVR